jgi:hypothetical protein
MTRFNSKTVLLCVFLLAIYSIACKKKEGCTDIAAVNFDAGADENDGSCTYLSVPVVDEKAVVSINFTHQFNGKDFTASDFNQYDYVTANNHTISVSKLKYLISNITFYKSTGESVEVKDYQFINLAEGGTLSFSTDSIEAGTYSSVAFTFGFDSLDNKGNYVDLNSLSWSWPAMIGGGYHFMQYEGKYMSDGSALPYNLHYGTASNSGAHESNHYNVELGEFTIGAGSVQMQLKMDLAEWFKNPYAWDLSAYSTMLMSNYDAQKLMKNQCSTVFSLGAVLTE